MKQVYIVTGSEDGIIGVYGNKKAAYNRAIEYTGGRIYDGYDGPIKPLSYAQVCKKLDSRNYYERTCNLYDYHEVDSNAEIVMMTLNR